MWYKFCLFFILINYVLSENNKTSQYPKIVGGQIATSQTQFPFVVSIRVNGRHICGGSIIDYRHVLTAAHCCFNDANKPFLPQSMSIAAGDLNVYSPYGVIKNVKTIIVHEKYDPGNIVNDIAVIKILGHFDKWNRNINAIRLSEYIPFTGDTCVVCGWGTTQFNLTQLSHRLLYVNIPIVSATVCRYYYDKQVTDKMICAGGSGRDSCQGDSGGPLVCRDTLAGIVSWGSDCGVFPGVYTAVAKYKKWIQKHSDSASSYWISSSERHVLIVILQLVFIYYIV